MTVRPTRRCSRSTAAVELTQWKQRPGEGSAAVDRNRLHAGDAARPGRQRDLSAHPGHARDRLGRVCRLRAARRLLRRHGHDYADADSQFGFQQIDYEAIQHLPILREAWVLSFRALAQTTYRRTVSRFRSSCCPRSAADRSLRGYSSWRFRDRNSLLLQAEWRIMANRFLDTAFFYDAGKVDGAAEAISTSTAARRDFGFGVPVPRPVRDAAADRAGQGQRRLVIVFRDIRGLLRRDHDDTTSSASCSASVGRLRSSWSPVRSRPRPSVQQRRRASIATIRSRASRKSQDASKAQPVRHRADLRDDATTCSSTPGHQPSGVRAQNVNTIDEVPDSSWFTNRIGTASHRLDELVARSQRRPPPDPSHWILTREKTAGAHPGFTAQRRQGRDLVPRVRPAVLPGRRDRGGR